jgi:hypothetical protein
MLLHSLQMFHSFGAAYVISTSQNLLFSAIRSGSKDHNEGAIRQLLSVSWLQTSCSLFGKVEILLVCRINAIYIVWSRFHLGALPAACSREGGVAVSGRREPRCGYLGGCLNSLVCGCYTVAASVPRLWARVFRLIGPWEVTEGDWREIGVG